MNTVFDEPRQAKVIDSKWTQFSDRLTGMGLRAQCFRALGMEGGQVIVHPDDLAEHARTKPFPLNGSLVAFES